MKYTYHIFLFTNMFRSLLRPSSGRHTRIQIVYKELHKISIYKPLDVTVKILRDPYVHEMSNYVIVTNR
jgi:hypothetical protein